MLLTLQLADQLPQHVHLLPFLLVVVVDVVGKEHKSGETGGVGVVFTRAEDANEELDDEDVVVIVLHSERVLQLLQDTAFK